MIKQKSLRQMRSATMLALKRAGVRRGYHEIYLAALNAIDHRLDINEEILPELIVADIGVSEFNFNMTVSHYPKLFILLYNCKKRTVVESFSIVPDLPREQEATKNPA